MKIIILSLCLVILNACTVERNPNEPIDFTVFNRGVGKQLVLLLPGHGDSPEVFNEKGFIDMLKQCNPGLGIISADAHLGYYIAETVTRRLYQDILKNAADRGIESIWIAGNSLGGLGSLMMLMEYNDLISGAIVLGPFLGEERDIRSLLESPDIKSWKSDSSNKYQQFWRRLIDAKKKERLSDIKMGTGASDRYIKSQQKLAELIGMNNAVIVPGKHNWKTWKMLWQNMLPDHPVCKGT